MKISALALLLLCHVTAHAQKHEMCVLNNRFYFVFPDSAKNNARDQDGMEQVSDETSETRIVYYEADKQLVFFAKELYVKTTANLGGEVEQGADYR